MAGLPNGNETNRRNVPHPRSQSSSVQDLSPNTYLFDHNIHLHLGCLIGALSHPIMGSPLLQLASSRSCYSRPEQNPQPDLRGKEPSLAIVPLDQRKTNKDKSLARIYQSRPSQTTACQPKKPRLENTIPSLRHTPYPAYLFHNSQKHPKTFPFLTPHPPPSP